MRRAVPLLLCAFFSFLTFGQTLDLQGPTQMGRCESETFAVFFTAHDTQTASALVFTVTRPNTGLTYVSGSAVLTLHDGTVVPAEPGASGLDLVWNLDELLGWAYELPPGETVSLEFELETHCGTISGTLSAQVDFVEEDIPLYLTDSQPIEILPGAVLIYKTPSVISAHVGDVVAWTITVENRGLGPIYNVVVTDTLGSGLSYDSAIPSPDSVAGQVVSWNLGSIPAGGTVQVQLWARVVACSGLDNAADVRFGCDGETCFNTAVAGGTATASIRLILDNPLLDFTPPTIRIPYCDRDGVTVTIPITNKGDGPAKDVQICVDFPTKLQVQNVQGGASWDGSCFHLPDIPAGGSFDLTFDLVYTGDWCAGGLAGTLYWQAIYDNVCGDEFRPPAVFSTYGTNYDTAGPPSLSVSLTGDEQVYICTEHTYNLTVGFSGLESCGGGATTTIDVTVDVPQGFVVTNAGGGTWTPGGDGTGGTITWTGVDPATGLSTSIVLRAPGTGQCGKVATLTATATSTDCCGCTLSASDSVPIAIECYQLITATREASPSTQEKCGTITYTNTYTFADDVALDDISFDELVFTEAAANYQDYVEGSLQITIDGSPASPITVVDGTPGGTFKIQGINDTSSVRGHTLVISYQMAFTSDSRPTSCPSSYTFYDWATLDLGTDCSTGDQCTEPCQATEVLLITAATPSMSVSVTGLPDDFVDPCGTYDVTVTLTKTSNFDPHNVRLQLENLNYYIVDFSSITCSGVCPASLTPTDYGTYYEWNYEDAFVGQPNGAQSVLQFQVRKRCNPGRELTATALFEDSCGYSSCSISDSDTPSIMREPLLYVYKTPEVIYATRNPITWTIYVINGGAGPAYEVWVDDFLGSGLEYVSSSVTPSAGVTTYPNQDHLGQPINGVSWHIAAMAPGEQRVITLVTRLVSCHDLWNKVSTSLGCGGEDCFPPVSDSSTVLIPSTQLVATSSTASPVNTCSEQPATIRIRNTGDPAVYELVVRETLPPGLQYISGTTRWRKGTGAWNSGDDPTISGDIFTGYTLEWTSEEIPDLSELRSRETLEIEFTFRALCNFVGGDFQVAVDYVNVCGEPRSLPVGTFRVEARRPSLAVSKTQISPPNNGHVDCGGEITWRIDVTNTSDVPIEYVWVVDELGSSFEYVSSTGGIDGGKGGGSQATWVIENLGPRATAQLTLTARHVACGDLDNSVTAWWGCGTDKDQDSRTMDADCLTDIPVTTKITASRDPTVSLSTTLEPTQVPACGTASFTLTIQNTSTATATAIDVRVALPAGLSYVLGSTEIDCGSGFSSAPDPVESGGYLYWYDPADTGRDLCDQIPPAGTVRLRFQVQASCYTVARAVGILVYYYDCCYTNQFQKSISSTIQPALPTISITKTPKTVALDCHNPADTVTWTITVTNTGQAQADWVRVEDVLGTNLVYVGSDPSAVPLGGNTYAWEFGPLRPGESTQFRITAYLSRPNENCSSTLRTNTVRATWGCGKPDGNPGTQEGCASGIFVQDTATVTIPDLHLAPSDIEPTLTCQADGNYQGRVRITVRNQGDAPVSEDFQLTIAELQTGWTRTGYFRGDFGGTLPINPNSTRTIWIGGWPVSCDICTYQFTISLDVTDTICECRENNNSATRTWTITLPDLTVRDQGISLTCLGDGRIQIAGTVTLGNEGCGAALTANVPARFTLYSRPGCYGTVLHQWTQTLTGVNIPAGGQQVFTITPQTLNLNACEMAEECALSLLIEADYTGSICECDGTNNTRCVALPVDIPDLTVRSESLALTCAGDGQVRISGTVTIGNEGCGSPLTASIPIRFVLSDGPGCSGAVLHEWTTTFTGVNIPAGDEQTFTVDHIFTLDLCKSPGCTVSLLIEADYSGSICECDGTNNTFCTDFAIGIPDLAVTAVTPDVPNSCEAGTVLVTVANVGCVASLAGVVVRITGDATGETTLPSIPRGGEVTVTVGLNDVLPCGTYSITTTVDPGDSVCECSSDNNSLGVHFQVVDPDLVPADLNVRCNGDDTYTVRVTVVNQGTEGSPPAEARLYIGGDLVHTWKVSALGIGESVELEFLTDPLKCGEDHIFRVVVDEDDAICECDEANNDAEATVRCPCPALVTDKEIAEITRGGIPIDPRLPIQAGDVITYRLSVTNVGAGAAFDVDVSDELPAEFLYISGSTNATWPSGSYTTDPNGAPGPSLAWDTSAELWPNESLTLKFQAVVTSAVVQGEIYTNRMCATGTEGDGTPIPPDMSATVPEDTDPDDCSSVSHVAAAVPALSVDKKIVDVIRNGISFWPTAAVEPGDLIRYRFTIRNVGQGIVYNVDFTDELPEGLEYDTDYADGTYTVDNPPASGSLGIPDGATGHLVADISAQINGGGTLVADFYAYVTSTVRQGVDLENSATATGEDGYGTPIPPENAQIGDTSDDDPDDPDADDTGLEVIGVHEPALALEKEIVDVLRGGVSIWPTPIVLWGDVIVYRVTVRNVGLGTAYDVDLTDELSFGLAYDASGDGTYTVDNPTAIGSLGIPDGAQGVITADISTTIAGGGTLVAVYRARVLPEAVPGQYLVNHARVTGADGAGTPIPEFNPDVADTFPDEDTTQILLGVPALVTEKTIYCEPCDPCAPEPTECEPCPEEPIEVRVGEIVRFQLTVRNVGYSRAYDIVVEDQLPKGFEYVKESAILTLSGTKMLLDPLITEDSVLTWITNLGLEAGESLTIVFAAQVTEQALSPEEVVNVMKAEGVDAFNVPIPADSSMYVPADNDPDDLDVLRLRVVPSAVGIESGNRSRRMEGVLILGAAGLAGLLGIPRRARFVGLLLLVAGLGLVAFSQGPRYMVELISDPPRAGILFGAGLYAAGELVQVSALPQRGFEFMGWFEDEKEISPSPIFEFLVDRNLRLVARFRPILEFLGLGGVSQGQLSLLPNPLLDSARLEIRSRYRFGFNPWEFRGVVVFGQELWRDAQLHFTGGLDQTRFGGGLMFNPAEPAYRSAYAMVSFPWEDLRIGFRVTHYANYGTPPQPALLPYLSVSLPEASLTLRFEEKEALTFKDATLFIHGLTLCCDITLQGTLVWTKEGFSYLRLSGLGIPLRCCGLTADIVVTFTTKEKSAEFTPHWFPYCDPCLTVYGDVLWDSELGQLQGLALYGYKIRCCFGSDCCPPGPGGYVEFLTAFDPSRVPGGFQEGEFEYVKFGFCTPGCCGGTYRVDFGIFFGQAGGLFGISRVTAQGGIPLTPSFVLEPKLEVPLQGDPVLSVGWNWRF